MKISHLIILCVLAVISKSGFCEYRVYQYYVKARMEFNQDRDAYLITSTLNPTSYVAYHGGSDSIEVDLLRTWMCPGHTGGQEYCEAPLDDIDAPAEEV